MNPFTPTFGSSPPLLVGRDADLADFREGLRGGPGSPERATMVTGLRGTGKTVMLNAYEDIAGEEGWLVISETATRTSSIESPTSICHASSARSTPNGPSRA